jgi:hypothetical protein
MSYIISRNNPFVSTKLTEKGREKLAKGQLNFKYWAAGDSEVNYGFEEIKDDNPGDTALSNKSILGSPMDNHPNIKYFVSKTLDGTPYNILSESDVKVVKLTLNNLAKERGFFDENGETLTGAPYTVTNGTVISDNFNGNNTIQIADNTLTVGNYIMFKITNETVGALTDNQKPTPHLWYKIESVSGNTYTLDRKLPLLANTSTAVQYYEYASGEVYENDMGNNTTTPYWDADTLSFDSATNIPVEDVKMLNINNIWSSNIIGLNTDTAEEFFKYGSNDMMGVRSPFLCYIDTISPSQIQLEDVCVDANGNVTGNFTDADNKAISVIHYTNNTINNMYGEFLYVDANGKNVEVEMPDLMYHRRAFMGGTGTGNQMGMTFITRPEVYYVKNSEIEYVELIEDPALVNGDPRVVGKVLLNHKTIIIDDEEIVAALSYKSGRNWTLPALDVSLSNPTSGGGVLEPGKVMYVTYVLENTNNGLPYNLPCQKYVKIENETSSNKDVSFILNSVDELPYMRKIESGGYDGMGFSANKMKVLYQIVDKDAKPLSNAWKESDFTSNTLTSNTNETIDPTKLESRLPDTNGFKITTTIDSGATTYVINDKLNLPDNINPEKLQFGDERFFYGNVRAYIGANVYRTVFDIKLSANEFKYTTNPTRSIDDTSNPPEIRVSEFGVYDNDNSLVFIGKLSEPMKLINGNSITVELTMDF